MFYYTTWFYSPPDWLIFGFYCPPDFYSPPDWLRFGFYSPPDWLRFGFYSPPDWLRFGFYSPPDWLRFEAGDLSPTVFTVIGIMLSPKTTGNLSLEQYGFTDISAITLLLYSYKYLLLIFDILLRVSVKKMKYLHEGRDNIHK